MNLFKKIKNLWKNNQEKNSERYIEREELKKSLEEDSKDILEILKSPVLDFRGEHLEKAILVQNLQSQRNLSKATDSLKNATWILALATIVFAWVAITDSPNSGYIIQTLQGIATVVVYFLLVGVAITLIWNFIKFVFNRIKRILKEKN